jgi:plasmid stabilization system protein ParE
MKKYKITITETGYNDLINILNYISITLKSPLTAEKFGSKLTSTMESLKLLAEIYPVVNYRIPTIDKVNLRRINYKSWVIIYTIEDNFVRIERVIHGSLIK